MSIFGKNKTVEPSIYKKALAVVEAKRDKEILLYVVARLVNEDLQRGGKNEYTVQKLKDVFKNSGDGEEGLQKVEQRQILECLERLKRKRKLIVEVKDILKVLKGN